MKHTLSPLLLPLTLLLIVGCESVPEDTTEADRQAIDAVRNQFADVYNRGDAAGVAALFTEEARLLPPNSDAVVGREAIQAFYQSAFEAGAGDLLITSLSLDLEGNVAYDIGEFALTIQPEGAEPIPDKGKYVVILMRAMGAWKVHVAITNTSLPPPEPPNEM